MNFPHGLNSYSSLMSLDNDGINFKSYYLLECVWTNANYVVWQFSLLIKWKGMEEKKKGEKSMCC